MPSDSLYQNDFQMAETSKFGENEFWYGKVLWKQNTKRCH